MDHISATSLNQEALPRTGTTLAAVIICRNEERNLPGLIANLEDRVDEIVVIDDRSSDESAAIAARAGPKLRFIVHPMSESDGYAGQRNAGADAASSDWLLHMDCDERMSPLLAREIREAISDPAKNGYRYRRLNHFLHRQMGHGGWNSWNRPQLARRKCHHFTGRIHETCEIDGGAAKTGQLDGVMFHLNDESFAERLVKSARYVEMTADVIEAKGRPVTGLSIFWGGLREFLKKYLYQQGFRDGVPGLISAMHSATAEFRARALVWDRQNKIPKAALEAELRGQKDTARPADGRAPQHGAEL